MSEANGQEVVGAVRDASTGGEPQPSVAVPMLAGFWVRVVADLVDVLVLYAVGAALGALFGSSFRRLGEPALLVGLVISLGYYAVLHSAIGRGRTPGKRLLRIEVLSLDGSYLPLARSLARALVLALLAYGSLYLSLLNWLAPKAVAIVAPFQAGAMLFVALACYLPISFHPWKRGLHDLVAGSVVVHHGRFDAARLQQLHDPGRERTLLRLCAVLAMVVAVGSYALVGGTGSTLRRLTTSVAEVNRIPGLRGGGVNYFVSHVYKNGVESRTTTLTVSASLVEGEPHDAATAALWERCFEIGRATARDFPEVDIVRVTLSSGYNIGIWAQTRWETRSQPLHGAPANPPSAP